MPHPSSASSELCVVATPHLTKKGHEHRMCLVFSSKVSDRFALKIKQAGGNFRRIGDGNKGWLVHPDHWEDMWRLMKRHSLWECADEIRRCIDSIPIVREVRMV